MPLCEKCGRYVRYTVAFCPHCGTPVTPPTPTPKPTPPTYVPPEAPKPVRGGRTRIWLTLLVVVIVILVASNAFWPRPTVFEVTSVKTAYFVEAGKAVNPTSTFNDTDKVIYLWFAYANAPEVQVKAVFSHKGSGMIVESSTLTLTGGSGVGWFSFTRPSDKLFATGEYVGDIFVLMLGDQGWKVKASVSFTIRQTLA